MFKLRTSLPDGTCGENHDTTSARFWRGKKIIVAGENYIVDRVIWREHSGYSGVLHLMFPDEWQEELSYMRVQRQKNNIFWIFVVAIIATAIFYIKK